MASSSMATNKNRRRCLEYSLDVITDGSEHTQHATIFLTISRRPTTVLSTAAAKAPDKDIEATTKTVLARYAITGLSSTTSRLCADQKLNPVNQIRAILCPTHASLAGLASFLLMASQAGVAKVAICGGAHVASTTETIASIVLRHKAYPQIVTCQVPSKNDAQQQQQQQQWWKIYQDEFVIVHGTSIPEESGTNEDDRESLVDEADESALILLYTIIYNNDDETPSCYSFCVMPPGCTTCSVPTPLPCMDGNQHEQKLEFILFLDPKCSFLEQLLAQQNNNNIFYTQPRNDNDWDTGLLIRAASQAKTLHRAMPFCFPITTAMKEDEAENKEPPSHVDHDEQQQEQDGPFWLQRLESCTSWILQIGDSNNEISTDVQHHGGRAHHFVSRKSQIWIKCHKHTPHRPEASSSSETIPPESCGGIAKRSSSLHHDYELHMRRLRAAYCTWTQEAPQRLAAAQLDDKGVICTTCHDENEIDLEDQESSKCRDEKEIELEDQDHSDSNPCQDDDKHSLADVGTDGTHPKAIPMGVRVDTDDNVDLESQTRSPLWDGDKIVLDSNGEPGSDGTSDQHVTKTSSSRNTTWDASVPHLLVLGTGCASPSPLRGSSGYALFLPTLVTTSETNVDNETNGLLHLRQELSLAAVIECGEGFLTTLSRHLPPASYGGKLGTKNYTSTFNDKLRQVRFIWISHAHLDHYGGLPCLVRAIQRAGGRESYCVCGYQSHESKAPHGMSKGGRGQVYGLSTRGTLPSGKKRKVDQMGSSSTCRCILSPVIIAPSKVLQYLDASLRCKSGKKFMKPRRTGEVGAVNDHTIPRENHIRLFYGVSHQEFEASPFAGEIRNMIFKSTLVRRRQKKSRDSGVVVDLEEYRPFALLRSVPVEHCPQAHALILGLDGLNCEIQVDDDFASAGFQSLHAPADNSLVGHNNGNYFSPFLLCFSGDTRPSPVLVRACQDFSRMYNKNISLLLHESTFDDDERGIKEARQKRHSTVMEALKIARQVRADACLLTHFSQRYPRVPPGQRLPLPASAPATLCTDGPFPINGKHLNFGFAADGLLLPLTQNALSLLGCLNACTLSVLSKQKSSAQ